MTGLRLRRKADGKVFEVVAQQGSLVVLAPKEFGSPVEETVAALHSLYEAATKGETLPAGGTDEGSPEDGWRVLADRSWEASQRFARPPEELPTVEEIFAQHAAEEESW